MSANTFGELLRLTTFGESHGRAIGGIIEGYPAGVSIDESAIQYALNRRRPGQSELTTERDEKDRIVLLSGVFEGKSLGTPIGFMIENENQHSSDYTKLKDVYRPSHADYTWQTKFGIRDHRGGGRTSARETASRVAAGAMAAFLMPEVSVKAFVQSVGPICLEKGYEALDLNTIDLSPVRCPDPLVSQKMEAYIKELKEAGDTAGGVIQCVVKGVPAGWGEPVFDKLHAVLGSAILSINAVKGIEFGSGFGGTRMKGSEHNDSFIATGKTLTNHSGGIQGGISNGEDIYFNVAFKPIASIKQKQTTVDVEGKKVDLEITGRHDPTVLPRAVPIVEAMTQLTLADFMLRAKVNQI